MAFDDDDQAIVAKSEGFLSFQTVKVANRNDHLNESAGVNNGYKQLKRLTLVL